MYNYKLLIEYDGINFNGWQIQNYTSNTVQGLIESSLKTLLKEKIRITGAGRTDAGVSAYNQVANFYYCEKIHPGKFLYSVNSILPDSITVKKITTADHKFHSRYSALRREYLYRITFEKKSIGREHFYYTKNNIDFSEINRFIKLIKKLKSFRSFCKNKSDKHDFACKINEFNYKLVKSRNELTFKISANRFLHSMVRALIGCALQIGKNKIKLKEIQNKIEKGEKISVHYLPAKSLFLNQIYY